jgi:hypothetical protein
MTTLQIGLALMGGVVVLAVLLYNRWSTQRNLPRRSQGGPELEPGLNGVPFEDPLPQQGRVEPSMDDFETLVPHGQTGASLALRSQLDPLIDVLVTLVPDHPVAGEAVLAAMPRSRRIGSKPFAVEAYHADSASWELPRPGRQYQSLQAGVQLANRAGALNEIEFSEFVNKTQLLADQLAVHVDFPDMMAEVARARELDQFASEHDAQMSFKIRATRAAWSPGYIVQQAERAGFLPGAIPGRMVLPAQDTTSGPLAVLQFEIRAALAEDPNQSALLEFDLLFDVSKSLRSENPYARLREAAHALETVMEGRLTDERGVPLDAQVLDQVGTELEALYDQLDSRDLAAGSPLARRLFS